MPVPKLDPERCRRRNRLTALRGRNAAPVRLLTSPPEPGAPTSARGTLPETEAAALERINATLGLSGDEALKPSDVYLLYPEVGNTNYVDDRFMFLGRSTLRNVAAMAEAGFAFMNSHRTGDLSTPTELPFGRTFAGRFETFRDAAGNPSARTLVGAYMLRGKAPNGANGPTTDDLYAGIKGGTIFDVSLGLYGGTPVCDVCGEDLDAYDDDGYLCPHVPGTLRKMTAEDVEAQRSRGVTDGVATYTLEDARPGEFSAVFDGAVPGAGFRKAVSLARSGRLSRADLASAGRAYRSLLGPGGRRAGRTSDPDEGEGTAMSTLGDLLGRIRLHPRTADELGLSDLEPLDDGGDASPLLPARIQGVAASAAAPVTLQSTDVSTELAQLRADLAAEREARKKEADDREAERRDAALASIKKDSAAFAAKAVADNRILPAGLAHLETLHAHAHLSAAGLPADGLDARAALDAFVASLPPHSLTRQARTSPPEGAAELKGGPGGGGPSEEEQLAEVRRRNDNFYARQGIAPANGRA
jgi:hypothetical protein